MARFVGDPQLYFCSDHAQHLVPIVRQEVNCVKEVLFNGILLVSR